MSLCVNVVCPWSFKKTRIDDAGFDIVCTEEKTILLEAGQTRVFSTSLFLSIEKGWYGQLLTRSGMALKGMSVLGGVIDSNYRGEVKVILYNSSSTIQEITPNSRIAQMVFYPVPKVKLNYVSNLSELDTTERGDRGFGSSGI
jgi:dUTP pyrophosphatase